MEEKSYHRRRRQWKAVNRARARFVRPIRRLWVKSIRNFLDGSDPLAISDAMRITYIEVGGQFARSQLKRFRGQKDIGDVNDIFDELMENFARNEMGTITSSIQETVTTLSAGIMSGELLSNDEKIKEIEKMINTRSKLITENEIVRASNIGQDEAVRIESTKYIKTWIATIDAAVRDAHADADGQVARGHEDFIIGGEALKYPMDPSGSVGNTINCRCVLDYQKSN